MTLAVLEREPIAATEHEQPSIARAEMLLDCCASDQQPRRPRLIGAAGEEIELPESVFRLLRQIVHHLARGDSVALVPRHKELTTQQAADLLNVSRPYLVQLLDKGEIPHTKTGAHRRVRFNDLMAYKRQRDARRRKGLARLTQMSQELGLYGEAQRAAE
jgi:excisionase family DNA binding protein